MKYTRTALGLLSRQYRSVLKKCFLINLGLFALTLPVEAAPQTAAGNNNLLTQGAAESTAEITETYQNRHKLTSDFAGVAQGGAIYNGVNITVTFTDSGFIANDVIGTNFFPTVQGGAIYNLGNITDISNTSFNDNFAKSEQSRQSVTSGGAINTFKGEGSNASYTGIAKITNSSFLRNYVQNYSGAYGGAISAGEGLIGNISGTSFQQNYAASSTDFAYGGAIKNSGIINSLGGSFSQNYVSAKTYARGGAIYNERNEGDGVSIIFTNDDTADIKSITANFSSNYAQAVNKSALGGAIYNTAIIGAINGNFSGNYATSANSYASGGAVYIGYTSLTNGGSTTRYNSKITSLTGDFTNNYASGTSAAGGAIYNQGTLAISGIQGTFSGNSVTATSDYAYGGAIYNGENAEITVNNSTFSNNRANSNSAANAYGGAVYNEGKITFGGTNTFSDNYQQAAATKTFNGIYNKGNIIVSADGTLNINDGIGGNNGTFTLNSGAKINLNAVMEGNSLTMNGGSVVYGSYIPSGSSKTYGNLNLSALTVNSGSNLLNSVNSYIANSNLGTVKLSTDLGYTLDINTVDKTADNLIIGSVASGSTGKIALNGFNVTSGSALADITDKNFKVKILQAPNNNIQLSLSNAAATQLGGERVVESHTTTNTDVVQAATNWGDVYQTHTTVDNTYGQLGLATTTTTNDSVGMNITRNTSNTTHTSLGDTLVLVNADTTYANKTFSATNANKNYTLSDNLTATKGNLTVNGLSKDTSTLNLNGKTGFNVGSGASLSLNNLTLSGGSGSTVTNSSTLNVSNSAIANSITLNNSGNLNLNGNNAVNTAVNGADGAITVSNGDNRLNATATQKNLTVNSGATLISSADNLAITNTINNNGTLQLSGGTLSQSVSGSGSTELSGNTALAAGKTITSSGLNIGTKTLTVNNTANGAINVSSFSNTGASGLNLANNTIQTATLGTVNLAGNLNYTLDINTANKTADKLIIGGVAAGSSGKVSISGFNLTSGTALADITDINFKVQVLQAPNNNIQLVLSDNAATQLGGERLIDSQTTHTEATIKQTTGWGDVYQTTTTVTDTYGILDLATTNTTFDSIGMRQTRQTTDTSYDSMGDTLVLVNADTTNAVKYFNATNDNPNYTLGNNLSATKGSLTVNGLGKDTSTLNLNGKNGFNVGSGASLSLNNLSLSGGSGSTVTNSSNFNVNNSAIANSITVNNSGTMTLSGSNTFNSTVNGTGSTTVNGGTTVLNAAMTQNNLAVNNGATLTTSATNLAIANTITLDASGKLQLTGGTLSQSVNGGSEVDIGGNVSLASGKSITTSTLNLGTGKLTADESSLHITTLTNDGNSALDIADGSVGTLAVNQNIILNGNLTTGIDIDLDNNTADKISGSVGNLSTGKVVLDSFNVLGTTSFADVTDKDFKIQILQLNNSPTELQLDLSNNALSQLGDERVVQTDIDIEYDEIKETTLWSDIYQTHTTVTDTYGMIGLATTSTVNDSIGMNITRQSSTTTHHKTDDTLRLVAKDSSHRDKLFKATDDTPDYTVVGDIDIITVNNLDIVGLGKDRSTLNMGSTDLILGSGSQLNLSDLTADTSSRYLAYGSGTFSAHSSDINGDILLNGNNHGINLIDTTMNGDIDLNGSNYHADLNNTTVNGDIDLDGDNYYADLTGATINGDILLSNQAEENAKTLKASNTVFNGDVAISNGNQTINLSGAINFNGVISSADDQKINVVIDNAGVMMKENTFAQADLLTSQSIFYLNNDTIENYTVKSLNDNPLYSLSNTYNIDIDIANRTADKITLLEDSSATVTIKHFYTLNGTFDDLPTVMTGNEFKVQILDAQNDNARLKLSSYAENQISQREYEINRITYDRDDVVTAAVDWSDVFYHKTQDEVFYGKLGLTKTKTTDDSIGIVPTESRWDEIITHESLGDTLKLINTNTEYAEKSFTTEDATARYTVGEDLGQTYGALVIAGTKDDTNISVIDFAGHNGFDIGENASVTASDVIFTDSTANSEIVVQNGGTMTLNNATVDNVSLALDGVLNINDNRLTLKKAVFGQNAELSLRVNTLADFGKLTADSVAFADAALLKVSLADKLVGFNQTEDIQLLQTDDGNFATIRAIFDNEAYRFEKKNDDGWYSISLIKTAQDVVRENNGSKNNEATASAWVDHTKQTEAELSARLNKQAQDDPAAFIDSLTALAPNDAPLIQTVEADNGGLMDMINMHMRGSAPDFSAPNGESPQYGGQPGQYGRPIQYRNMPRPKPKYRPDYYNTGYTRGLSSGDMVHPAALWLNAYKGKSEFKANGSVKGFDTDRTGFTAALEKYFTAAFKAGFGYAYETDKIDAFKRDVDVDMHRAFVYAQYQPYKTFINGALAYGTASYKETKTVAGQKYGASYDTSTFSAQTTLGYETDYVIPEVGLRYYRINRDEYTDEAKQKVSSNDMNILRGIAGVRVGADFGDKYRCTVRPELYGGISYDLVSDSDDAVITLPNGVTYNVQGETPDKLGFEFGGGVSAEFAERFSLSAQYLGSFRKNYTSHTGLVGMKFKF